MNTCSGPAPSILAAYRELVPALRRQHVDPTYDIDRPLPSPAEPQNRSFALSTEERRLEAVPAADGWLDVCAVDELAREADAYVQTVLRRDLLEPIPMQGVRDILDYHSDVEQAAQTAARVGAKRLLFTHMVPAPTPEQYPEWVARAAEHFEFEPVERGTSPAERFVYTDGQGEFGVIASVTEPFCESCDRIRLTAEGQIRNCLFALDHVDLRPILRGWGTDEDLVAAVAGEVDRKWAGHAIGQVHFLRPSKSMSQLGG